MKIFVFGHLLNAVMKSNGIYMAIKQMSVIKILIL